MDVEQVCSGLSAVWAAVLQGVLASALRALGGSTPPARLAVIAMGRLGGGELGYGSDADVLFVCEPLDGYVGPRGRQVRDDAWSRPSGASSAARARTRRW